MKKKKVRNKARDFVGDYYKTNRMVEEENQKAREAQGEKKGWSKSEVLMVVACGVALVGIVIKYLVLG